VILVFTKNNVSELYRSWVFDGSSSRFAAEYE